MAKVSELKGAELDYWVARAIGVEAKLRTYQGRTDCIGPDYIFAPSYRWDHGGPIIDELKITVVFHEHLSKTTVPWSAGVSTGDPRLGADRSCGPTPLIAAMRAVVAEKFGEEVPDAL